jgi:hypothetical protein
MANEWRDFAERLIEMEPTVPSVAGLLRRGLAKLRKKNGGPGSAEEAVEPESARSARLGMGSLRRELRFEGVSLAFRRAVDLVNRERRIGKLANREPRTGNGE